MYMGDAAIERRRLRNETRRLIKMLWCVAADAQDIKEESEVVADIN